jgi:cell division protein FtsL
VRSRTLAPAAFRIATVCLLIVASAGVARVALAAQAAEATVDAWALKTELKAERLQSRSLEADRGSLASPSRIEMLACETLNMDRPVEVCYLELPAIATGAPAEDTGTAPDAPVTPDTDPAPESPGVASGILATLVDLAAGEAQVLLVGDMGLGLGR